MFFPVNAPLEGTATALRALRRSLNSPVVGIESLPVGPASAAIALHLGAAESPRVTIAIRSVQSRHLAFYSADEERAEFRTAGVAVDAALSFAESMGFLFDDDEVEALGDDGPRAAGRLWNEFISMGPVEAPELLLDEVAEAAPEPLSDREEPLLEDVVVPEIADALPVEALPSVGEAGPAPAPVVVAAVGPGLAAPPNLEVVEPDVEADLPVVAPILLTKFRRAAASMAEESAPDARLRLLSRF